MFRFNPRSLTLACAIAALATTGGCSSGATDDGPGAADTGGGSTPDGGATGGPDVGSPDVPSAPTACRFDTDCDAGLVCNLITRECVAGRACESDTDCDACAEVPLSGSADCGHGLHLTSVCSADHGGVCTRSRASCEPCETDADCGRVRFGNFLDVDMVCVDYAEVGSGLSGKYCARPASASAPVRGFEQKPLGPNGTNVYVNPNGCPAEVTDQFLCPPYDPDGDGVADSNPECADFESACIDDPCPGTGGQRCANTNLPGVTPVCGEYCVSDADCPGARPFCNRDSGVCQTGCSPGSCPNDQVCHASGECGAPCHPDLFPADPTEVAEADSFCADEYGEGTYCNLVNPRRELPRLSKAYRDANACAPLGCERGQGEQINRDCGSGEVCDLTTVNGDGLPEPSCVPGCFSSADCTPSEPCQVDEDCPAERPTCMPNPNDPTQGTCRAGDLDNPQIFRCVDAAAGSVQGDIPACREAYFSSPLEEDNRDGDSPRIGACCETGCLDRGDHCIGQAAFCCGEPGSPYDDPASCLGVTQDQGSPQASPGLCFEAPTSPFCVSCTSALDCNASPVEGLSDAGEPALPYNPASVWPRGVNEDCEDCTPDELEAYAALGGRANGGSPFVEWQRCIDIDPTTAVFGVCSVAYDPGAVEEANSLDEAGVPRGWRCGAGAVSCTNDSECNGLTCIGYREAPDGTVLEYGNCKCGENGAVTTACPAQLGGGNVPAIDAPTRMRCVEAETINFRGPAADTEPGDMFCAYTFDCVPPTLRTPDAVTPQTLPDACNIPERYRD